MENFDCIVGGSKFGTARFQLFFVWFCDAQKVTATALKMFLFLRCSNKIGSSLFSRDVQGHSRVAYSR